MKKILILLTFLFLSASSMFGQSAAEYIRSFNGCITDGIPTTAPHATFGCIEVIDTNTWVKYTYRAGTTWDSELIGIDGNFSGTIISDSIYVRDLEVNSSISGPSMTLSGDLTLATGKKIIFDGATAQDYIYNSTSSMLHLVAGGNPSLQIFPASIQSAVHFYPKIDVTSQLGDITLRWQKFYSQNISDDGTKVDISSDFSPSADLTYALGISTRRWGWFYSKNITDNGTNVGINTILPQTNLDVFGTSRITFDASNFTDFTTGATGDLTITTSGSAVRFQTDIQPFSDLSNAAGSGSRRFSHFYSKNITDNASNVGINTLLPNSTLDVFGTIRVTFDASNYTAITTDLNGDLAIVPTGGNITFNSAYTWPAADGTANQVPSTDGAGTISWVDVSSIKPTVQSKGASYTVLSTESTDVFYTTASATYTLPTPASGLEYVFINDRAGGGTLQLVCATPASETINSIVGATTPINTFYQSATAGATVKLIGINSTTWYIEYQTGTWTIP